MLHASAPLLRSACSRVSSRPTCRDKRTSTEQNELLVQKLTGCGMMMLAAAGRLHAVSREDWPGIGNNIPQYWMNKGQNKSCTLKEGSVLLHSARPPPPHSCQCQLEQGVLGGHGTALVSVSAKSCLAASSCDSCSCRVSS
jgi:hypothetical protein